MNALQKIAVLLSCCVAAGSLASERLVLYCNEDNERVAVALGQLRAAVAAQGTARRHQVRIEHLPVDYGNLGALRAALREAAARRPAAIIAASAPIAQVAREEAPRIPLIFGMHQDPMELGLAASFRRPGGNRTGVTLYRSDESKRLELLREIAPRARRLGVLIDEWWDRGPHYRHPSAMFLRELAHVPFGFEVEYFQADTLEDLRRLPGLANAQAMAAWYVPGTKLGFDHPAEVARVLASLRRPAIYSLSMFTQAGGLVSYHAVFEAPFASWAKMLDLVLDGFPAGEIPIERPQAFELAVNVKAACEQGIVLPKSILLRATHFY